TAIARQMIMRWGMSERLGTVSYSTRESPFMSGGDTGVPTNYSEETAELIDDEVQIIVRSCYDQAVNLLATYRPTLDRIAQELRRQETIDIKQLHAIMQETGAPIASTQKQVPSLATGVLAPPPPSIEPVTPPEVQ